MFPTIRNLNQKLDAWTQAHELPRDHFIGATWNPKGVCCFPEYPTLQQIEMWFDSNAACEDCRGKGVVKADTALRMKICQSCKGSGFKEEFR